MKLIRDVIVEIFAEAQAAPAESPLTFPGIKFCGLKSRNGRVYPEQVLTEAVRAGLYEGAPVCLEDTNHKKGNDSAGRHIYERRVGVAEQSEYRPDRGVFGTLVLNPKHVYAESIAWDILRKSKDVGISHVIEGESAAGTITKICTVRSLDIAFRPATTSTFTESEIDLDPAVDDAEAAAAAAARDAEQLDQMLEKILAHARFKAYMDSFAESLKPVAESQQFRDAVKGVITEVMGEPKPGPIAIRPFGEFTPPTNTWQQHVRTPPGAPIQFVPAQR